MTLYTKCIFHNISPADGIRVSVMSRHTLNDGRTIDSRITLQKYDEWLRELAPPSKLVGDWYKQRISWNEFEVRYSQYLRNEQIKEYVKILGERALNADITILCVEDTSNYCHRRLLAEECQRYFSDLKVVHK